MTGNLSNLEKNNLWLSFCLKLLTISIIYVLLFTYVIHYVKVDGDSMFPTFQDGDKVFVSQISKFRQNDVIILEHENKVFIKRIVAISGQEVSVNESGHLVVDGIAEYTDLPDMLYLGILDNGPIVIPEGYVFVLGDNRNNSYDSRYFGYISENEIFGKVLFKI